MIKLTHMEAEPPEMESPSEPGAYYPSGLCLCLDQDALEKLGFDELPHAGEEFTLEARAVVRSSGTADPDVDGDVDHAHVELQITHLGIEGSSAESRKKRSEGRAAKLYGGDTDKDAA